MKFADHALGLFETGEYNVSVDEKSFVLDKQYGPLLLVRRLGREGAKSSHQFHPCCPDHGCENAVRVSEGLGIAIAANAFDHAIGRVYSGQCNV